MPSLNFQERFATLVESGAKRQTIRAGSRWKVGDVAYLFTGMRTKKCRRLFLLRHVSPRSYAVILTSALPFRMDSTWIEIDGQPVTKVWQLNAFARADGFRNFTDMLEWFETIQGLPFEGQLLRW